MLSWREYVQTLQKIKIFEMFGEMNLDDERMK
jgi:hypothetical protein